MDESNLYSNTENELISDESKSQLIQRVFENRIKSLLADKVENVFDDGGGVFEKKIYTPYEFIYELLPKVYGRPYVVSDDEEKQMQKDIDERIEALKIREQSVLLNAVANSIYDKSVSETDRIEIEIERRKIESDKIFISELELQAYLYVNDNLNREDYTKLNPINVEILVESGLLVADFYKDNNGTIQKKYVYKYDYISGNLYEKNTFLEQNKNDIIENGLITEEQFVKNKELLLKNRNKPIKITDKIESCLVISPYSKFAKSYILKREDFTESWMKQDENNLTSNFTAWIETEMDAKLLNDSPSRASIQQYFINYETIDKKASEDEKNNYADFREKSFRNGRIMMFNFLNSLTDIAKLQLVLAWNEKFNFYTEPQYHKFPVACSLNSVFKNGSPFTPNESQVQSMQFINRTGSGLIAYGVGVGKTASAIMNLSYLLGSNQVNKPIVVVPNAVYDKWKLEMFGGEEIVYEVRYLDNNFETLSTFDKLAKAKTFAKEVKGEIFKKSLVVEGHIPQWNKYVELYNLSEDYVKKIKNYSEENLEQMAKAETLTEFLSDIPENYDFGDDEISAELSALYYGWNRLVFNVNWDNYIFDLLTKFKQKNNIPNYDTLTDEQYEEFQATIKTTKKQVFEKEFKTYKKELPYILGVVKEFEDKTIFLATYEGVKHLGLSKLRNVGQISSENSKFVKIWSELSQGGLFQFADFSATSNLDAKLYKAVYGRINDIIDLGEFNFDGAIFDESHFVKNTYTDTLGEHKVTQQGYLSKSRVRRYNIGSKNPSSLALSGYFLSRYINKSTDDKNVIQLTATPFTNSPNEIYGMLALTNFGFLNKYKFKNLTDFYDIFMDVSYDLVFSAGGVERKEQLVGFQNLPALRNMIYAIMNYKSGEDANIKRPKKYLLPNSPLDERSILPETSEQNILFKKVKDYIRGNIDYAELCENNQQAVDIDEMSENELLAVVNELGTEQQQEDFNSLEFPLENEDDFFRLKKIVEKLLNQVRDTINEENLNESDKSKLRVQIGLNILKQITLSPYLSICAKESGIEPSPQQYVESSPKINYAVQCIKSIHDYEKFNNKELSGCIIYMNIGINVKNSRLNFQWSETGLEKIRSYLVNILGYSYDDISIVSGKVSKENREKEKNRFLKGRSIIMLGSSAISTGVDLQENSSTLFLCDFDWNPTTNEQVAGRIHRQGNRFANVRIVYPMIRNSFDPPVFQKLYEKTLRIKLLWDKDDTGAVLDTKEFDLGELRKRILDEPEDLARFEIEEKSVQLNSQINLRKNRIDELKTTKQLADFIEDNELLMRGALVVTNAYAQYKQHKKKIQELEQQINILTNEQIVSTDEKEKRELGADLVKLRNRLEQQKSQKAFEPLEYVQLGTDENKNELLDSINKITLNSNSDLSKLTTEDRRDIYANWLAQNFPRFHRRKYNLYVPEGDDTTYNYIDYDGDKPRVLNLALEFRDAIRKYNRIKVTLELLDIRLENIDDAVNQLQEQVNQLQAEKIMVENSFDSLIERYSIAKTERIYTQITLEEKVNEFAELNYLLEEQLSTFRIDLPKTVVSPVQILNIKPNVKDAEIVEGEIVRKQVKKASLRPKTPRIIGRLKKGLVVRTRTEKDGMFYENDLFYDRETNEYVKFTLILDADNNEVDEMEDVITEADAISFYESMQEFITNEFYEKGDVEEVDEEIEVPVSNDLFTINLPDGFYVKINPFYTATVRNLNSFKTYLEREDEIFGQEFGEIVYVDNTASKEWVASLNKLINDKKSKISQEDIEEITEVGGENDEKAFILENIAGLEIILEITEDEEERQTIMENINGLKILLEL